jgi:hypothetical protein
MVEIERSRFKLLEARVIWRDMGFKHSGRGGIPVEQICRHHKRLNEINELSSRFESSPGHQHPFRANSPSLQATDYIE